MTTALDRMLRLPLRFAHGLLKLNWLVRRPRTFGAHALALTPKRKIVLVKLRYAPGWRLPGGGRAKSEDPRDAVLRELREEMGLEARIIGVLGDYKGTTGITRFYVGEVTGGDPGAHGEETDEVRLVPREEASRLLNMPRDRRVLDDLCRWRPSGARPRPRPPGRLPRRASRRPPRERHPPPPPRPTPRRPPVAGAASRGRPAGPRPLSRGLQASRRE